MMRFAAAHPLRLQRRRRARRHSKQGSPAASGILASGEGAEAVRQEIGEAQRVGVQGVPFFIFASKYAVSGAQPADQLARAIRQVSAEVNAQAAE